VLLSFLLAVNSGDIILLGKIFVSDLNGLLINFYQVIQLKIVKFIRAITRLFYFYNKLPNIKLKGDFYYKIRLQLNLSGCKDLSIKNAVFFFFFK
jgi:site-specific DNA-adenine methylase